MNWNRFNINLAKRELLKHNIEYWEGRKVGFWNGYVIGVITLFMLEFLIHELIKIIHLINCNYG